MKSLLSFLQKMVLLTNCSEIGGAIYYFLGLYVNWNKIFGVVHVWWIFLSERNLILKWFILKIERVNSFSLICCFFIVKLHLQGYSVHSLLYLNKSSIPNSEDEENYRAKFDKWRVSLLMILIKKKNSEAIAWLIKCFSIII